MKTLLFTLCAAICANIAMAGTTFHDNKLCFENVDKVSYTFDGSYSITSGQPWDGISQDGDKCINIRAGKQGSSKPLNWVYSNIGNRLTLNNKNGSWPLKSPFAFKLDSITLTAHGLSVTCKNIYVAQISTSTDINNSWAMWSNIDNDTEKLNCSLDSNGQMLATKTKNEGQHFGTDTIYDNQVEFTNVANVSIKINSPYIYNNRAFMGGASDKEHTSIIHIASERGNNKEVVQKLQADMLASNIPWDEKYMVGTLMDGVGTPEQLSFAVKADLSFSADFGSGNQPHSYSCKNIYLGQGEKRSKNNWWIFANDASSPTPTIKCYLDGSSTYQIFPISAVKDKTNQFKIN